MSHVVFVELSDVDVVAPFALCLDLFSGDPRTNELLFGRPSRSRRHHRLL